MNPSLAAVSAFGLRAPETFETAISAGARHMASGRLARDMQGYGVLGPYKIERYAKLPQRSKTVTTGLGSIKTTWIRVYSASNRLLGLENGWPFRRFGGGATLPPSPLSPLGALSHISQSLTDAPPGCPRTSALIKARLIDINRQRGHATAQQLRKTAEKPPAQAGKVLLPAGAPNGTSRRSPRRTPSRASCAGALWVFLLQPGAPATNARRLEPVGGGRQVVSRPSGGSRWTRGSAPAGRAAAGPPRGSRPGTGREGVRTGPPRDLASVACSPGRPSAPTLRRAGGGRGGAPRAGLQLGRGGFGVGGGLSFGVPELAVGTMGGAGAHDPWATAKHASGVRRALTPERRAPPILDLRRAKTTVLYFVWPNYKRIRPTRNGSLG